MDLSRGRPVGDEPILRDVRLAALCGVWQVGQLAFGLQLHALRTRCAAPGLPPAVLLGATATSQLEF